MSGRMRTMIGGLVVVALLAGGVLWWAQRDTGPGPEFVTADGELAVVDGVLTFTPAPGYSGRSEVMYTVSDAEGLVSAPVLVTLRVSEPG